MGQNIRPESIYLIYLIYLIYWIYLIYLILVHTFAIHFLGLVLSVLSHIIVLHDGHFHSIPLAHVQALADTEGCHAMKALAVRHAIRQTAGTMPSSGGRGSLGSVAKKLNETDRLDIS